MKKLWESWRVGNEMKMIDVNVLLYAVNVDAVHHEKLRIWWETALGSEQTIGLAWIVLLGFLRLSTNPKVFPQPLAPEQAIAKIAAWMSCPNVRVVRESEEHWSLLRDMLGQTGTAGNLTTDAHLAALAISHGAVLASCDTDFARFPKLRWENPLDD